MIARKFHELNQAYELLLDPLRRLALDAKLRVKLARAQRFKSYDNKRKNLVEELEERERAFKKARMEKQKEEVETWRETERIKEEGKKLREQKEKEIWEKMHRPKQEEPTIEEDEDAPPAMGKSSMIIYIYPLEYNLIPPQICRPARYNRPPKIPPQDLSKSHHTIINSRLPLTFRRDRRTLHRPLLFDQT
jgi:curved DNA-binding protein CbpA